MKLKNYNNFEYNIFKNTINKFTEKELMDLNNSIFIKTTLCYTNYTILEKYYKFKKLLQIQLLKIKKENIDANNSL